jgi:hypothetical protein
MKDVMVILSLLAIYSLLWDEIKVGIKAGVCVFGSHVSYLPVAALKLCIGLQGAESP